MTTKPIQPFGRRGRAPSLSRPGLASAAGPDAPPLQTAASRQPNGLPPDLIASLLHPPGTESAVATDRGGKVPRSFRAAILAGLIVAILNAAANAAFAAHATAGLNDFSLGSAKLPVAAALLMGALWSGGRSSAVCLLVAHWLLARMGRTSHIDYMLGGGGAALALALIMSALGGGLGPGGLGMEIFSGMAAGLFYRQFAGTQRNAA